jgi:radical SAM superfamily enzyme YgiQ (UPF0313 family)
MEIFEPSQEKYHRLLLISVNRYKVPYPVYPLGISYLKTYLHSHLDEFLIKTLDLNIDALETLADTLRFFRPHYVGLSLRNIDDVNFFHQESFINEYLHVTKVIRTHTSAIIILGGSGYSIFPQKLFEFLQPDYGIQGEGEVSLARLLASLQTGTPDLTIDGLVYRQDGTIRVNERSSFLTTPDLELESPWLPYYWDKAGMINIQTKRGCPYHCIYCTYPMIDGSRVRTLDPERIVHTIRTLYESKGIDHFFFTDSVFNISPEYNETLSRKLISSGIPVKWGAYFAPFHLPYEQLELYARAGLTHIEFGTESLSDRVLESYGKRFRTEEVVKVSGDCNKAGIYYCHFMILGGYGETEETLDETFENSKRISNTVFFPFQGMRVYPGTRLHQILLAEGHLNENDPILEPFYYLAPEIDYTSLKSRAEKSGRRWVFPDEDLTLQIMRMRKRKRKGTLWHHLRY